MDLQPPCSPSGQTQAGVDAIHTSLARLLYLRQLTLLMQRESLSGMCQNVWPGRALQGGALSGRT